MQAKHNSAERGFAATGFADKSKRLALLQLKGNAIDRAQRIAAEPAAAANLENFVQVLNLQRHACKWLGAGLHGHVQWGLVPQISRSAHSGVSSA